MMMERSRDVKAVIGMHPDGVGVVDVQDRRR